MGNHTNLCTSKETSGTVSSTPESTQKPSSGDIGVVLLDYVVKYFYSGKWIFSIKTDLKGVPDCYYVFLSALIFTDLTSTLPWIIIGRKHKALDNKVRDDKVTENKLQSYIVYILALWQLPCALHFQSIIIYSNNFAFLLHLKNFCFCLQLFRISYAI